MEFLERLPLGPSAWDHRGQLYCTVYPDRLYLSECGSLEKLERRYVFPDAPKDVRALFIDHRGHLLVSLKGHLSGAFGRTYLSRDQGVTFVQVLDHCVWGLDEDSKGNLYAGVYHERKDPDCRCALYKSIDGGVHWIDVTPTSWRSQTHVHGLAVEPGSGWIYANLGDKPGLSGCWRSKGRVVSLTEDANSGARCLRLENGATISPGAETVIHTRQHGERAEVAASRSGEAWLAAPLEGTYGVQDQAQVFELDWCNKFGDGAANDQYIGIAFKDGAVYLSDDNVPKRNPMRTVVYRAVDDGSLARVEPDVVHRAVETDAWGSFFLRKGPDGRLWTAARPFKGTGVVWNSDDGDSWQVIATTPEEPLDEWRRSHSFRDMTMGETGDKRSLFAADGRALVSIKGGVLVLR